MPIGDIQLVLQWWSALFLVGAAAFPLTKKLFSPPASGWPASPETSRRGWFDRGYFFSKAVGMAVVSYIVFLFGTLHVLPFTFFNVIEAMIILFVLGILLSDRTHWTDRTNPPSLKLRRTGKTGNIFFSFARRGLAKLILCILLEEVVFFGALLFWSWVKAHEPSIRGLEKFMDYGFMQSLFNSTYFPAPDMWWQGGSINYYFFGHLVTAVLTKLSGLDLSVTFNLMLATLFALTLTMSFSIGVQIVRIGHIGRIGHIKTLIGGLLTAFLVTLAGNMQTIYAFTKGYLGDNVVPFWTILWNRTEFFSKVREGMLIYWYANATRFIPFTIHEFPSYSFVVSDVHGHVLSIPFVLLAIGLLITLFCQSRQENGKYQIHSQFSILNSQFHIVFYGFLLGILLMTNALDGPIYLLLFLALLVTTKGIFNQNSIFNDQKARRAFSTIFIPIIVVISTLCVTALPFLWHFNSFAAGIGVNCPPGFLANTKIGPFIFEGVDKCQKSPLWMMELLWGFFWYTGAWLFIRQIWKKEQYNGIIHRILKVFFLYGLVLIVIPEFFYVKDIYPAHFRSNTMFKLGYEAFILWSIISAYVIVHFIFQRDNPILNIKNKIFNIHIKYKKVRILFFILLIPQLFLVSIYPWFSVRSYFGELRTYQSIYGLKWLEEEYPYDYEAIMWLRNRIQNSEFRIQNFSIVEADGESYTDYNHISAFSGVPTIVGWAVHEWLWRGSYDVVAPRREEVAKVYESPDLDEVRSILETYNVRYIVVGKLEREKYTQLNEERMTSLGTVAFRSGDTVVYEVGRSSEVGY
ncbi:MAG: hypothetical protein UV63_C0036G0019 [Microgenomates group bacterium GW2011_GWC1_43_11]|uniref:YYY membrane protein n=2 Tax=Candidatus Gottesmaniibacteriota TaxID=1752720 RepID=A0A0G1IMM8_9BACT|nr:MAG: hypothetical protein UV63_C0036G0019 [Microgenomates group bacterium GW2011_GWC1_43_11]KKT38050.1 MAG: YYY membrane protein [Candidatus Gottesmanbacteria bacterium GW2011_GWB1_44_11c]KKT60646.1 MAG: YYY membrane protein [Candidatus Gottesmanbacteria bacterium GW2011_GWA1_44_24b]HCM81876.1 hypothetical protein [Patescibacteria group bacterium]